MTPLTNEEVLQLGPQQHLMAVWTAPNGQVDPALVAIFINAGVIHRIGPHRMHVKLARELAANGIGCLRLDLSGIGDSRAPLDAADFRTQAVRDIRLVLDAVQDRTGCESFCLVGLCSGAAHAQAAALADHRVKGIFLIDGYMYPTWRGRLHFLRRMLAAYGPQQTVARLVRNLSARVLSLGRAEPGPSAAPPETQRTAKAFATDMQSLVARGVDVCLLFTGSVLEVFAHRDHLRHGFGRFAWVEKVRCLFEPDVDHTLTLHRSQAVLSHHLRTWSAELQTKLRQQPLG